MDHVLNVHCDKETILQRNYKKMTILWPFFYNSLVKVHGKKIGSHSMIMLYPNLWYIEMCYEGTALYVVNSQKNISVMVLRATL